MRNGVIYSGVLHAAVFAALVLGLPSLVQPLNETIVPVDLVVIETADAVVAEQQPEPEPPKAETPAPEPPRQEAKLEPPPAPEPAPEPEAKPEPERAGPEPEPEPEPAPPPPEAKAEPEPEPEPIQPPPVPKRRPEVKMAQPKPEPKKEAPKPKPDQLASILRNVEKLKEQPRPAPQEQPAKAPVQGTPRPQVSLVQQNEMVRAIQTQVSRCWRLDPGAREAEDMVVEIHVLLNPDGSVRRADIVDVVRLVQDAYFRSAAENAKRAIDACSPYRLPLRQYDVWRELTLRFNPREMFGT